MIGTEYRVAIATTQSISIERAPSKPLPALLDSVVRLASRPFTLAALSLSLSLLFAFVFTSAAALPRDSSF